MEAALTQQPAAGLGFIEKSRVAAAVAAAALILYTIGWMVAEPVDPNLAVTFVRSGRAIPAIWPALAALAVVASMIATVVAGPRLPQAGVFAGAIGLGALSLRGGSMQIMLANEGATSQATRQAFMRAMAIDAALWAAIMVAVWIAVAWAYRWVYLNGNAGSPAGVPQPEANAAGAKNAGKAMPFGWPALVVTGVIGVFVVWLTDAREPVASVLRKQTIASVAAGLYLGAMAGRYFTGIKDVRWYVLAVPAVAFVAYLVSYLSSDMSWAQGSRYQYYIYLATTPPHDLARPLPIEYIAVGTAAAIAGYWGGDKMEQVASQEAA
jgi:hypothetical protein